MSVERGSDFMPPEVDTSKLADVKSQAGLLSDRVYQVIRDAILKLDFEPGAVIRKAPICERLEISRSPVADALKKLASEGLVDVIPQSATRVSKLSMEAIREESFIREALEVAAIGRAAKIRTDEQLGKLQRNLRMQEMLVEDGDFDEFYRYDEEFHELLQASSGISRIVPAVELHTLQVHRARLLLLPEPGRTSDTVVEHQKILVAVRAQDVSGAQTAMRQHLSQLIKRLEPLEKERPELFDS